MAKKRVKYNWLFIIQDLGWSKWFEQYKLDSDIFRHSCKKKELSVNRLARAFIVKSMNELKINVLAPNYIVGQEESGASYRRRMMEDVH